MKARQISERQEFGEINHMRVERLYALEGLTLPRKRKKKRGILERVAIPVPEGPNERWSMDFVHDSFDSGMRFRMLDIADDPNRLSHDRSRYILFWLPSSSSIDERHCKTTVDDN